MKKLSYDIFKNCELISIFLTCFFAIIIITFIFTRIKIKTPKITEKKDNPFYKSSKLFNKLNKKDYYIITVITILYSIISLWNLGTSIFPTTTWQPTKENQTIIFKIKSTNTSFDSIYTIYGAGDNNSNPKSLQLGTKNIKIYGSNDLDFWEVITDLDNGSIYQYNIKYGSFDYKYIKIESIDLNNTLTEIALKEEGIDNFLELEIYEDSQSNTKYPANLLIDEQDKIPFTPTYYDEGYFDEIYHPRNAWEIANSQLMYTSVHPLLGTSIMALSIKIFGFSPLAYRLPGAIFGILMIPLFYLILKLVFNSTYLSSIGTLLFSADFMHLTTSRIATLEPYSVFFILLMIYFMLKYFYTSFFDTSLKTQFIYLALSGVTMGIAWSVKWTALYSSIGLAILFFTNLILRYKELKKMKFYLKYNSDSVIEEKVENFNKNIIYTILWCILFFVIIPTLIYVFSYSWTKLYRNEPFSISTVIKQNLYMFNYHKNLQATHPYQSNWYHWLLNIRPIWYYSGTTSEGYRSTISNFSNPIISWTGLPSLIFTIYYMFKKKNTTAFIISVLFLSAFLPWVSIGRCLFSYHFYPSTPFLIMAIVFVIDYIIKKYKINKKYINIYIGFTLFIFIIFMPVITGFGTSATYFNTFLKWLPSWYFGS
ncbi:MAG: phospholipid carrier-dependent glycosyltransferase [Erysipelotrichaceae bacterium]|nr:phospholipid carrier-dependent glycosyltransferase [Erysipelotrichaceae bacterium]